jgi:AcrR family transcriptional regulator
VAAPVKSSARAYDASRRRAAAAGTRRAILRAATELFIEQGYAATTMAAIATRAGVALDTVYATVGRKPALFRLLIETAISGTDAPMPAEERDYVKNIRAAPDARKKIELYAAAIATIAPRIGPLLRVLQAASTSDPELGAVWREIAERRARNMRLFAEELAATGQLRAGLSVEEVADVVWSMNAAEFHVLLVHERGWGAERFGRWLADAWQRLLLADD